MQNWFGDVAPVSSGSTAIVFTQSARTTSTVDIGSTFTLASLTFDDTSNLTTLNGNTTLSFSPSSGVPQITQNSATNGGRFAVVQSGNNLLLDYTAVTEPGTCGRSCS